MDDTIAAIPTPHGYGGVGIVRLSGPLSLSIAQQILDLKKQLKPRTATLTNVISSKNEIIDQVIAIYFQAPHSFTGENIIEIQGHGGPLVLNQIITQTLIYGARLARPGEFSERAFLNNKIDLVQAEAISQIIHARSEQALAAARKSLSGDFSKQINNFLRKIINYRMYIEAAIDFPDEEIDLLSDSKISTTLAILINDLQKILQDAKRAVLLQEGVDTVLVGKPNVGKSSLLNCLTGAEHAIVTDIPGTTRDIITATVNLNGILLNILDTAGIRETECIVEQIGVERSRTALSNASLVLMLIDAQDLNPLTTINDLLPLVASHAKVLLVKNKIDLIEKNLTPAENFGGHEVVEISVTNNLGIDNLILKIKEILDVSNLNADNVFFARSRHNTSLEKALNALYQAQHHLFETKAFELLAYELLTAQNYLGEITGAFSSDDLLGEIFSNFCIGK
jgi:tRNA modification GTPase